jgi:hypothetical protein
VTKDEYRSALIAYAEKTGRPCRKAGASPKASPAVCPPGAGSLGNGQAYDRSKLRALAEAMGGPCIVRDVHGNHIQITADALRIIPIHEGISA